MVTSGRRFDLFCLVTYAVLSVAVSYCYWQSRPMAEYFTNVTVTGAPSPTDREHDDAVIRRLICPREFNI
jgi:hypothetical protein